jgi:hypothetical protein
MEPRAQHPTHVLLLMLSYMCRAQAGRMHQMRGADPPVGDSFWSDTQLQKQVCIWCRAYYQVSPV